MASQGGRGGGQQRPWAAEPLSSRPHRAQREPLLRRSPRSETHARVVVVVVSSVPGSRPQSLGPPLVAELASRPRGAASNESGRTAAAKRPRHQRAFSLSRHGVREGVRGLREGLVLRGTGGTDSATRTLSLVATPKCGFTIDQLGLCSPFARQRASSAARARVMRVYYQPPPVSGSAALRHADSEHAANCKSPRKSAVNVLGGHALVRCGGFASCAPVNGAGWPYPHQREKQGDACA